VIIFDETYIPNIQKDYTNLYTSYVTKFGSNWSNSSNTGTFHLNVNNTASNSNANITTHLKFSDYNMFMNPPVFRRGICDKKAYSVTLPLGKT
jgi:hypothetical protein